MATHHELTDAPRDLLAQLVAAGADRCVEKVVAQFPEIAGEEDQLLELIYLEHVLKQEQGRDTSLDLLTSRFPTLHERLARLWEVDRAIHDGQIGALSPWLSPGNSSSANTSPGDEIMPLPGEPAMSCLGRIGEYHCVEVLGRGGMGVVYRGIQQRLGRVVAVKTIEAIKGFADPEISARLLQEARLCAKLQHENIVHIFESGMHDGIPYFSMELVARGSLLDVLAEGPLRPRTAAQLVAILAGAVAYAHSRSVLHRDLKPANVLLAPCQTDAGIRLRSDAEPVRPKLTDFGLAKCLTTPTLHTHAGVSLGTPSYMAPEQVSDGTRIDHRADVYALGAILYHCLSGRPPFQSATVLETLHNARYSDPLSLRTIVASIPRDLETICNKSLAKDPSRRYQTATELAEDLHRYLSGSPIQARPIGWLERSAKWSKRHPAQAVALAAVLLVACVTSGLWYRAEHHRRAAETAVADSRVASTQTLAALRTLTQDIVIDKLARQQDLSDGDRAFLDRIAGMYDELSKLPHQGEDRRLIRAEGLYFTGLFQRQLSNFAAAFRCFEQSVAICEEVYRERPSETAFLRLADSFEHYVAVIEELNQLDTAISVSLRRIDVCQTVTVRLSHEGESRRIVALAKAHQQLANIFALKGDQSEACRLLRQGEQDLRRHLAGQSGDDACRFALANTLRSLSSTLTDHQEQLECTEQAVQILRDLLDKTPDDLNYTYSLSWAIYDHSYALDANGATESAAMLLDEPIQALETLNTVRPLFTEGRQILAYLRGRRGQLYLALEDFHQAKLDYVRSLELAQSLVARAPTSFDIHRRLVRSAVGVAQVLVAEGNGDEAHTAIQSARDAIDALRQAIPNVGSNDHKVRECEMILAQLEAVLNVQ